MCEGSASFAVDCDGVEGACGGHEVLLVSLLMRPRSDRGRSCEWVTGNCTNASRAITPFMFNEEYRVSPFCILSVLQILIVL